MGDSGPGATLGSFESRGSIGPQIGFIVPLGSVSGYINLKGYKEFRKPTPRLECLADLLHRVGEALTPQSGLLLSSGMKGRASKAAKDRTSLPGSCDGQIPNRLQFVMLRDGAGGCKLTAFFMFAPAVTTPT